MSLKDLISTLIESAFTSKKVFIANTSAPNWAGKITIYSGTSANQVTQTAPADGYYQQHVNGYPSQGYNDISAPNETRAFVANTPESSAMIRVAKGEQVVMSVLSFDSIISRTIAFIPCIGGGLSSILQALGGGLWLRLNHFLSRFSSSLAVKQCLVRKSLKSQTLARTLCNIPLRQTAMRVLNTTDGLRVSSVIYKFLENCARLRAITMDGQAFTVRAKRATRFITDQLVTLQPDDFFVSSQQSAQTSLCLQGGAL